MHFRKRNLNGRISENTFTPSADGKRSCDKNPTLHPLFNLAVSRRRIKIRNRIRKNENRARELDAPIFSVNNLSPRVEFQAISTRTHLAHITSASNARTRSRSARAARIGSLAREVNGIRLAPTTSSATSLIARETFIQRNNRRSVRLLRERERYRRIRSRLFVP